MLARTKIAGLVVALMALSLPVVYADNSVPDKDSTHQDEDWHDRSEHQMMAQVLNLSEDQQKQLKDTRQKQKEAMRSTFEEMKTNREAIETEIVKAAPDMNKINDLQAKIKTAQAQMVDNHLNSVLEIKKILTPEQFAGYMALEKQEKMMKHDGHGQFGHKGESRKMCKGHKHEGDKADKDHGEE